MHMCAWHLCKLCNAIVQNPRVSLHPIFSSPSVCEALWSKHGHLLTHTNVNRRCLKRYVSLHRPLWPLVCILRTSIYTASYFWGRYPYSSEIAIPVCACIYVLETCNCGRLRPRFTVYHSIQIWEHVPKNPF